MSANDQHARHRMMAVILRASIAEQITALRLARGLSQEEFAKRIGTNQSTLSGWEDPRGEWMTADSLLRIAKGFDVALMINFTDWQNFLETYCSGFRLEAPESFPSTVNGDARE